MQAFWKSQRTDLAYTSALLLVAAVPLWLLRAVPTLDGWLYYLALGCSAAALLALLWAWRRAASSGGQSADDAHRHSDAGRSPSVWRRAGVAAALAALTIANFYLPLRLHFWGGGDEHIMFSYLPSCFWCTGTDLNMARPLWLLPIGLGRLMTPDRVDGFLLLAALLCLANGVLLTGIVSHFVRDDWLIPLAAGALLIVNPCDLSRFYVIWTTLCYWTTLFFLLLAVRLYLASFARGSRLLLAGACVALTAAGLGHEGVSLVGCLVPGLVWLSPVRRHRFPWIFAWLGTMALLVGRFGVHLLFDGVQGGYQAQVLSSAHLTAERLWSNAFVELSALLSFFRVPPVQAFRSYGLPCAAALVAFAAACAFARGIRRTAGVSRLAADGVAGRLPETPPLARLRRSAIGAAAAVLAGLAALAPFLPLGSAFRTEFLAAPGQAALLAFAVGAAAALLPRYGRAGAGLALTGWLLACATACAWADQRRAHDDGPVSFETSVDVVEYVHAVSPQYAPGTLVLLVFDAADTTPFGIGYALDFVGYYGLDHTMIAQTDLSGPRPDAVLTWREPAARHVAFTDKGVRCLNLATNEEKFYGFDALVLFHVSRDAETSLLERLPQTLVPPGADVSAYAPLARMKPGPVTPAPFFRPLAGDRPPHDVFEYREGVLFGAGWGDLDYDHGKLSRQACDGAELLINPGGPAARGLTFLVDPGEAKPGALRVQALDESGGLAATADVGRDCLVRLELPLRPDRINRFRLGLVGGESSGGQPADRAASGQPAAFRVVRAGGAVPFHGKYVRRRRQSDIVGEGLMLGRNWHGLEGAPQGPLFRWVENDAEIDLLCLGNATALRMEVEAGPGMGGRPCVLSVADRDGRRLGERTVTSRAAVTFPLPPDAEGTTLRMSCTGGGEHVAGDPRVMNFRVFHIDAVAGE
jgi:hypothetical protein